MSSFRRLNFFMRAASQQCACKARALDVQEYYGRALERGWRGPSHKSCPDYRCCATIAAIMIFIIEAAAAAAQCKHPQCPAEREEEAHSLIHIPFFVLFLSFQSACHALCGPGDYVTLQSGAQRMICAESAAHQRKERAGRAMNNLPAATMITSSLRKKLRKGWARGTKRRSREINQSSI